MSTRKTRLCRYESRSSFLTSRREIPFSGVVTGGNSDDVREVEAEVREVISVVSVSRRAAIFPGVSGFSRSFFFWWRK